MGFFVMTEMMDSLKVHIRPLEILQIDYKFSIPLSKLIRRSLKKKKKTSYCQMSLLSQEPPPGQAYIKNVV